MNKKAYFISDILSFLGKQKNKIMFLDILHLKQNMF